MAFLKRIAPYAFAVLLLTAFYVSPPLGKIPYEYLRAFWLYSGHLPSVQATPYDLYSGHLPSVQATPYDYLMFVVQWPFATCAYQECTYGPLPNKFTIHGIWPSNDKSPQPVCDGTKFNPSEMDKQKKLKSDLQASWPDLIRKNDMGFWRHEYDDHGRCCDDIFPQTKYFERAQKMWSTYRVEVMFQEAGCTPGNRYTPTKLKEAVKTKTTKNPALRCRYSTKFKANLLWEVVICYDHHGTNVMDCNSDIDTCKYSTILYKGP